MYNANRGNVEWRDLLNSYRVLQERFTNLGFPAGVLSPEGATLPGGEAYLAELPPAPAALDNLADHSWGGGASSSSAVLPPPSPVPMFTAEDSELVKFTRSYRQWQTRQNEASMLRDNLRVHEEERSYFGNAYPDRAPLRTLVNPLLPLATSMSTSSLVTGSRSSNSLSSLASSPPKSSFKVKTNPWVSGDSLERLNLSLASMVLGFLFTKERLRVGLLNRQWHKNINDYLEKQDFALVLDHQTTLSNENLAELEHSSKNLKVLIKQPSYLLKIIESLISLNRFSADPFNRRVQHLFLDVEQIALGATLSVLRQFFPSLRELTLFKGALPMSQGDWQRFGYDIFVHMDLKILNILNCQQLSSFCLAHLGWVFPYLRKLRLDPGISPWCLTDESINEPDLETISEYFFKITSRLKALDVRIGRPKRPQMQDLLLSNINNLVDNWRKLAENSRYLQELCLRDLYWLSEQDILDIIAPFGRRLKALTLTNFMGLPNLGRLSVISSELEQLNLLDCPYSFSLHGINKFSKLKSLYISHAHLGEEDQQLLKQLRREKPGLVVTLVA